MMARYIENLNSCTDPTSGDYLWIVDASAAAADKDRKVDVGLFAQKAVANTFTAAQTAAIWVASVGDNGSGGQGGTIQALRNTNATNGAPGDMVMQRADGTANCHFYVDNSSNLRVLNNTVPTNSNLTTGTVVGTQTSSLDSKDVIEGISSIEDVLAAVQAGAEAVRRFTYKNGAFNGEEFEGVVVDYAPHYGMDRDAQHAAGKSLNLVNAVGDLLRAVAWLVEREQKRGNA